MPFIVFWGVVLVVVFVILPYLLTRTKIRVLQDSYKMQERRIFELESELTKLRAQVDNLERAPVQTKTSAKKASRKKSRTVTGVPAAKPEDGESIRSVAAAETAMQTSAAVSATPSVTHSEQPAPIPEAPGKQTPVAKRPASLPGKPKEPSVWQQRWSIIEKQLVANWTGILGAIVLTVGFGFLAIYAALQLEAFWRFVLICLVSAILFGVSYYMLHRLQEVWHNLAYWLRSSGAALFLFGCLGSGFIPGLTWITSPTLALLLLTLGIAANMASPIISRRQELASFHVVISLTALAIIPQSTVSLLTAAVIVIAGLAWTYRHIWQWHTFITLIAALVYHVYWYLAFPQSSGDTTDWARMAGRLYALSIGVTAAFIHYQKIYRESAFRTSYFAAHVMVGVSTALQLAMHYQGSVWIPPFLLVGAAGIYIMARMAKRHGISWLHTTDLAIAQTTAVIGLITLTHWELASEWIGLLIQAECALFYFLIRHRLQPEDAQSRRYLSVISQVYRTVSGLAVWLLLFSRYLDNLSSMDDVAFIAGYDLEGMGMLLIGLGIELGLSVYHRSGSQSAGRPAEGGIPPAGEEPDSISRTWLTYLPFNLYIVSIPVSGILQLLLGSLLLAFAHGDGSGIAGVLVWSLLPIGYILLRRRLLLKDLLIPTVGLTLVLAGYVWIRLFNAELDMSTKSVLGLPVLIAGILAAVFSHLAVPDKTGPLMRRTAPGIYLIGAHMLLWSRAVVQTYSDLLPGILWLLLAPLFLEASRFLQARLYSNKTSSSGTDSAAIFGHDRPDKHLHYLSFAFLVAFLIRHIGVHLQFEDYLGPLKIRLWIELLALAILAFFIDATPPLKRRADRSWFHVHPALWEASLIFLSFTILLEAPVRFQGLLFLAVSAACLEAGRRIAKLTRLRLYAIFLYWFAGFHTGFLVSSYELPEEFWYNATWLWGIVAILAQFGLTYLLYRYLDPVEVRRNIGRTARRFGPLVSRLEFKPHLWIYFPFFAVVAVFFAWSFERSILTLLWVTEAMMIYVFSIVLRENIFRMTSMAVLVVCLVRLFFFDLAQSGTLMRAVVCLGVGIMMLIMNSLYNKFRSRF